MQQGICRHSSPRFYAPSHPGKPFFNAAAWKKANNLLKEIRAGLYSDPPGMRMYTYKMENGKVKRNKYGMKMIECIRGTNRYVGLKYFSKHSF